MTDFKYVLSKPPRDDTWLHYHGEMTGIWRYFVRGDDYEPFYTTATLDEINEEMGGDGYVVFDCGWKQGNWQTQPYRYGFPLSGDVYEYYASEYTEKANHFSYDQLGVKKNGNWIEKRYYDITGENGYTSFIWYLDGTCFVIHAGMLFRRNSKGEWSLVKGSYIELDGIPSDNLIPQARRMRAEKWNGFYDDIVRFLIEDGIEECFI